MKVYNVLIFPGGTEIGLEIRSALAHCKEVRLFSAGSNVSNHAPYAFARHFDLPSVFSDGWVERLNEIIEQHNIDYIFPAYDDVIVALAQNAAKIRARIVTSPLETCLLTRSKSQTYDFFRGILPIPRQYKRPEDVTQYPVFVKPDKGQGSQGTLLVCTSEELLSAMQSKPDRLILEYLPGEECTIDCFSDRDRGLLFCGARRRVRTKAGISMHSVPIQEPLFEEYARTINHHLKLYGAWFFQMKQDTHGEYKLLEIAPRIAGTMALNRVSGVNFPLLSLFEQERIPVEVLYNRMDISVDRALKNRYSFVLDYDTVYLDFDDCLVLNGEINLTVVQFLFQCLNKKKRVVLVSKHQGDLHATLAKYRLTGLFDQVIHVAREAQKADYIVDTNSIFIDDSFSERRAVWERHGIPTFDCSMIEMLIDERI